MSKRIKAKQRVKSAVSMLFEVADGQSPANPLCGPIRTDVDLILGKASDHAIKQTTPNEDMLSDYLFDSVIANLYLALNKVLAKYPNFTPINSTEIDNSSSIGDVRSLGYSHCNTSCTPI